MKRLLFAAALLSLSLLAQPRRVEGGWELENPGLKVTVTEEQAHLTVLEKASGTLWTQEDPARQGTNQDQARARRAAQPITVDGNPEEWRGTPHTEYVWLPWMGDNGEANCSGGAKLMWDDEMFYLYVRVRDDQVVFGGEQTTGWWEADSVEFWIDSVQVGLHLGPGERALAVDSRGNVFEGSQVAKRLVETDHLPGYELEVAMPLRHFPVLADAQPGIRFSFALGLNDADPKPDAPVKRDRQSYWPRTWVHSAPATFAVAVLADPEGTAPERTRENDRSASAVGGVISDMRPGPAPNSLQFNYLLRRGQVNEIPLVVTLELVGDKPFLDVTLACTAGTDVPMRPFNYPLAFYPPRPETYFLAVANYANGSYLPVGDSFCRREFLFAGGDLPFLTVTDGTRGLATIMLTPWDAAIQMQTRTDDPDQLAFPAFRWHPEKGLWGPTRKGRYAFYPRGGHVAACKIYRELATEQGLVRTFTEKAKAKPEVRRLFGAVNWWGGHGLGFVREAVAAGMTRGLLNGRPNPEDMAEIVRLGWAMSEYDNYEDINDGPIARASAPVAEHAVVMANGEYMTAWVTRDKDMNPIHTYMKQCTAVMTKCARLIIPPLLETYPYNARFLDVTTATGLKECYSPLHPLTRTQDQARREELCAYVGDELGLIAGGEHGRYYDVRFLDYHEGMMGGGNYTWPAGYLRPVTEREQIGERYLKYGIDPANRAPLFELVFHDCVVNYWYWGATNDYLHAVAPEITDRKTAMNVLYGTPPMMWVNSHGLRWGVPGERQLMIDIYQQTCKLHEIVADQEMVSHEFLDPARKVQRTTFADGTVCTVNFADEPYVLTAGGREFRLGTNDFYVRGPRIVQWRLRTGGENDEREVFIRTRDVLIAQQPVGELAQPGFRAKGKISVQRNGEGARISVQPGGSLEFDLAAGEPAWANLPAAILRLDDLGRPAGRGPQVANGIVRLGEGQFALLVGDPANQPDVVVAGLELTVDGQAVDLARILSAAQPVAVRVRLENRGLAPAVQLPVTLRLDGEQGPLLLDQTLPQLAPGEAIVLTANLPLERMDGERRLLAQIGGEAFTQTGPAEASVRFAVAVDRERFPVRQPLAFRIPAGDTVGLPVELPLALAPEADPANLRVLFANGTATPAQFEPAQPAGREGTLVFVLPAGLAAGETAAELLGVPTGDSRVFPPTSRFAVAEDGSRLQFATYEAKLILGTLTDIAIRRTDGTSRVVVGSIIESSKETGWSDETGEVTDFALEANGPVRAVFRVGKTLRGDFKLTRRFIFYGDRCEIVSACNPHRGLLTRTMYAVDGIAVNETGAQAVMDGKGDAEDFGFKGSPQWFAAFGPTYRSACFALTPASTFTYWDGGTWRGQIGLGTASGTERRVYVWGGEGAEDADYAKALWQAYAELRGE